MNVCKRDIPENAEYTWLQFTIRQLGDVREEVHKIAYSAMRSTMRSLEVRRKKVPTALLQVGELRSVAKSQRLRN